jgi:hypothetical protein
VEVHIPNHPFPVNKAVFMDFRQSDPEVAASGPEADHADGVWRVPSFLYVLPVDKAGWLFRTCTRPTLNRPISVYRLGEMPTQSCGQSVSAPRVKAVVRLNAHTEL